MGVAQTMKALFVVGTLCLLLSATHAKDVCGFDGSFNLTQANYW